jgi:hypothetical protein
MGFQKDVAAWGIVDAIKAVHIEAHVVDTIASLVKSAGIENEVDLVEGMRTILFFTKEEQAEAYDEYEAAKAAGIDVSVAEWLTESEVEEVRRLFSPLYLISDVCRCRHMGHAIQRCAYRDILYGLSSSSPTCLNSRRTPHRPFP